MRSSIDARGGAGRRLRILHAVHDFLPRHRAGSEIYVAALCREQSARHHVTVLCADYDPLRPHGLVTWRLHDGLPVAEITNNWVCDTFEQTYRSPSMSARIGQVLDVVQPHVVHVHNLLNLSFDLPALARARGIPIVATLHDYTLVCASGGQRVHRAEQHLCRTIDAERCARCFRESPFHTRLAVGSLSGPVAASSHLRGAAAAARRWMPSLVDSAARTMSASRPLPVIAADIQQRLARAREVFETISLFVAPSRSIADECIALGVHPAKVRVSDYGFETWAARGGRGEGRDENRLDGGPEGQPRRADRRLRIGYVGSLVWHKGLHVLVDAVRQLPAARYELRIYGSPETSPDYVAELRGRAEGLPIRFMGGFDPAEAPSIYAGLDVLVVPSVWLENSPLVIHEAFMARVPVIGARIGGIANLLEDGRTGRLYEPGSSEELAVILRALLDDRTPLERWANALPAVKTIGEDAREWEGVYAELAAPAAGTSRQEIARA